MSDISCFDVLDSAVKIGFGAIIAFASTYVLNNQKYDFEKKKDVFQDKRDVLKDVCSRFENVHAQALVLSQDIDKKTIELIRKIKKENDWNQINGDTLISLPKEFDYFDQSFDTTDKMLIELNSLQGLLFLYDFLEMSTKIDAYIKNLSKIRPSQDIEDLRNFTPDGNSFIEFNILREDFYQAANKYLIADE